MVDFISEVEEELRKDDYNKFLRKFGPFIIGLLVAIVAFVGYLEWSKASKTRTARAAAASYLAADDLLQNGRLDEASRAFLALADVAPDGYAGLSLMRAAVIATEQGNDAEAVRLYDAAADRLEYRRHTDLAKLKSAYVLANQGAWNDAELRAEAISEAGAPYEFLAREIAASAAQNLGKIDVAKERFGYLANVPGVPERVARRAQQALTLMNTDAPAALPAPTDAAPTMPEPATPVPSSSPTEGTE